MSYKYQKALILFSIFISANPAAIAASNTCHMLRSSQLLKKVRPQPSQVIVVKSLGGIKAKMILCQRHGTLWKAKFSSPFKAVIGKNGVAVSGEKKEGDLKTPVGLYPIGAAFGIHPLALQMDYKYITKDDKFIDDIHHKAYNSWVSGSTDATSYETMFTEPYTYGAIINYNMNPIIAGAGSAIFIHLWRSQNTPTSGCIALDKKHLLMMLHWLDKNQHPYVLVL
ncbi:L,D-transpeptidase [Legionella lytica]|uniref:L,D-transpeptidase n=1 Tax=Legionella lytica TaxID=96232 RepID=A0ABW8D776_9GAMM